MQPDKSKQLMGFEMQLTALIIKASFSRERNCVQFKYKGQSNLADINKIANLHKLVKIGM